MEDEDEARSFLLNNNYYRISGYTLTLRNHDKFYPSVSFRHIMEIYNFDREFRILLLSVIERIEVSVKSVYAYEFSGKHGPFGYLESACFINEEVHKEIITKSDAQMKRRISHEAFLKHFVEERNETIPFWAYVDLFTISDISRLYTISEDDIKRKIAKHFGMTFIKAPFVMKQYLYGLTILRNLCAHGSRIYNRLFVTKPDLNKRELSILRKDRDGNPDNSKVFGYLLIIKRILDPASFYEFSSALKALCVKYPFVDMKHYGFCDSWQDVFA
ncbi:MAG: Abi family protein [Oscillospiraceae bacterium]